MSNFKVGQRLDIGVVIHIESFNVPNTSGGNTPESAAMFNIIHVVDDRGNRLKFRDDNIEKLSDEQIEREVRSAGYHFKGIDTNHFNQTFKTKRKSALNLSYKHFMLGFVNNYFLNAA